MDNSMRMKINALAEDIIKLFDIPTPIEDMGMVVRKLGGRLQEDREIGCYLDGIIDREDLNYPFCIRIPYRQSENRKNFTVAHELGHLFLHMGYMIDSDLWERSRSMKFRRSGNSEVELQANEFAVALLMPRGKYKEILDKFSEDNYVFISKVADYFHVSIDAATDRGKWLGYLKW